MKKGVKSTEQIRNSNRLWVVEWHDKGKKWDPTVGAYLTRQDALDKKKKDWEFNNPNDRFRIRKYIAARPGLTKLRRKV